MNFSFGVLIFSIFCITCSYGETYVSYVRFINEHNNKCLFWYDGGNEYYNSGLIDCTDNFDKNDRQYFRVDTLMSVTFTSDCCWGYIHTSTNPAGKKDDRIDLFAKKICLKRYYGQSWVINRGSDVLTWRIEKNYLDLSGMVGSWDCNKSGLDGFGYDFPCAATQRWKIQFAEINPVCKLNYLF